MVLEEVCSLSARMVVNQVSMKTENERITAIIKKFQHILRRMPEGRNTGAKSGKRRNVRHENRDIR